MKCPICGGSTIEQLYVMNGFELVKCLDCDLVFQSKIDLLDGNDMIDVIYDENWTKMKEQTGVEDLYNHYLFSSHFVNSYSNPGDSLLEIGCGTGEFLHLMQLTGKQVTGMEPSKESCAFAKSKYQLDFIHSMWDVSLFDNKKRFDNIAFWHVLEHIANPIVFLTEASSILKENGKIFFSIPNQDCLYNLVMRNASPLYTERDHLFHYSTKNLPILLSKSGLVPEKIFLWEGPGRLKTDWSLYKKILSSAAITGVNDEYSFLAWLRNTNRSYELFCVAKKAD